MDTTILMVIIIIMVMEIGISMKTRTGREPKNQIIKEIEMIIIKETNTMIQIITPILQKVMLIKMIGIQVVIGILVTVGIHPIPTGVVTGKNERRKENEKINCLFN